MATNSIQFQGPMSRYHDELMNYRDILSGDRFYAPLTRLDDQQGIPKAGSRVSQDPFFHLNRSECRILRQEFICIESRKKIMSINATQNMQKNILNDTEVLSDEREIMFPIQNYAIFTGYNSSSEKLKSAFKKNEEGTAR